MDLADRFLLLAVAADNDGWPLAADDQPRVPAAYRRGAAAALLAELVLRSRVTPGRRAAVLDPAATGDAELDAALDAVGPDGRRVPRCVTAIAAARPELARLHGMCTRGLLHTYPGRGGQRLFVRENTTALDLVVAPLHTALRARHCDEPTRALLDLLRASRLHRFWLKGLPPAERDRRLRELTRSPAR
jgi:hypothetical protein